MSSQCTAIPSPGCRSAEMVYHDRVAEMADILRESGSGVQLWLNEMGYADYRYSDKLASLSGIQVQYNYEHTPQYAAAALLKAEIMALASGAVALTGWYRIDDFPLSEKRLGGDEVNYHLGLIDTDGHRKPTLAALKSFKQAVRSSHSRLAGSPRGCVRWAGGGASLKPAAAS